ncbi:MAG TPA: tRNA (adenosine(37)-N6)-dimethylallyltransferase MiaA [Syntrophales bacterium]|nr:tRNA (adenosine(37)-N6)-dimethylallyltransferase MiaA [Syntrophales bacterium]HOX94714.1 tRNA (adenosine(37)-N6)-dimethylallyltransferase MiaA [Syntrophales bacterium]HPI58511.1 tRNA (adenosine(37)-N6)-dimethylallyltransferase MiaA [Syntrophales bacterium]HPN26226.1 tRNA (adenosine(37)-N6)-dimethylallyltransferase MiaA [Syntrophales bacterium]HQM30655.1 tRNA (adenosine(37)-N6)-dimethylallyltransferase MiaA [Syntrophales bacterium]
MRYNLIVILGPNASGKTRMAARLAKDIGTEIVSADSRQVYRGMDIGTGKDLSDYVVDGVGVPHHIIDIVDPDHEFSVYEFQRRFHDCFSEIAARGKIPILAGGTGLYIESVLRRFRMLPVPRDPDLRRELEGLGMEELARRLLQINPGIHNTTDLGSRERVIRAIEIARYTQDHPDEKVAMPEIRALVFGISRDRKTLRERIAERLRRRLDEGMIEEVRRLHDGGLTWEALERFGLEYRYVSRYLRKQLSREEMFNTLNIRIRQFAKRQETWFRGMEKRGIDIIWINGDDYEALRERVRTLTGL